MRSKTSKRATARVLWGAAAAVLLARSGFA